MTKIFLNKSEIGAGTRGASLGPDAIRFESLNNKSNLFIENEVIEVPISNQALFEKGNSEYAINISKLTDNLRTSFECLQKNTDTSEKVIILSADHSMAIAHVSAVAKKNPNQKLGVLWVDAHADIHTPYTSPSGNIHGMPLAALLGEDNLEYKQNNLDQKVEKYWKELQNQFTSIEYNDLFYIGIRSIEKAEINLIKNNNISVLYSEDINNNPMQDNIDRINSFFDKHDKVYISFDIDSLDPDDTSYGTGTPAVNGILFDKITALFDGLLESQKYKYFEIVEINPLLDTKNKLAKHSLEILELIADKFKSR